MTYFVKSHQDLNRRLKSFSPEGEGFNHLSDYKNQKTRIILLSNAEIDELYSRPTFNKKDRETFFALSNSDYKLLDEYRTQKLKIYFILQLGYFRATQQFYNFKFEDIWDDVSYLLNKYFGQSKNTLTDKPHRKSINDQQNIILELHNYIDWSTDLTAQVIDHLVELIRYYPKGSNALRELFKYFQNKRIVIPKYRALQDMFSKVFSIEEVRLNDIISSIPENIKQELQEVANNGEEIKQLNVIRCDQKDFQYTAVNNSLRVSIFNVLKNYIFKIKLLEFDFNRKNFSDFNCKYQDLLQFKRNSPIGDIIVVNF